MLSGSQCGGDPAQADFHLAVTPCPSPPPPLGRKHLSYPTACAPSWMPVLVDISFKLIYFDSTNKRSFLCDLHFFVLFFPSAFCIFSSSSFRPLLFSLNFSLSRSLSLFLCGLSGALCSMLGCWWSVGTCLVYLSHRANV